MGFYPTTYKYHVVISAVKINATILWDVDEFGNMGFYPTTYKYHVVPSAGKINATIL